MPAELFAKAETSKIVIKGADLSAPIEITDRKTLTNFIIWTGPGTGCEGVGCQKPSTESFIVDWSQTAADHPSGLHRYKCRSTPKCRMSDSSTLCSMNMTRPQSTGTFTSPAGLRNGIGSMC